MYFQLSHWLFALSQAHAEPQTETIIGGGWVGIKDNDILKAFTKRFVQDSLKLRKL